MLVITEKAGQKIKGLLAEEQKEHYGLRVYVTGGGCHGFEYGMVFEEQAGPDDTVIETHGVKVYVDAQSASMLQGAEVDYQESADGAGFAVKNPQAKSSCGCGTSNA